MTLIDKSSMQAELATITQQNEQLRYELNSLTEKYSILSHEHKELKFEYNLFNFIEKSSIAYSEYQELEERYKSLELKYNALVAELSMAII